MGAPGIVTKDADGKIRGLDMERKTMTKTIAILILVCAGLNAQDEGNGNRCNEATIKGAYGFTVSGTRPSGPPPAPLEQFVGLALTQFDGHGGLIQSAGSSHGSITGDSPTDTGSGTYSLNPDCSGTMTLNISGRTPAVLLKLWIVVVNRGKEIHTVVMTPTPNGTPVPASNLTTSHGTRIGPPGR
jgi:hypothetical protein